MSAWLKRHYAVPAAALLALFVWTGAYLALGGGWNETWRILGVQSMEPSFGDLRTITHSLESVRQGQNPYVDTSFDPWGRLYNYPSPWLLLASFGIGPQHTDLIGVAMAVMLVAALTALFTCVSLVSRGIAAAAAISPPMLFLVERGNCDSIIFALLTLGFWLTATSARGDRPFARGLLIVLLTVLKIYPVAAAAALVRDRRSLLLAGLTALLALAALYATTGPENLAHVFASTPQSFLMSYGSAPILIAFTGMWGREHIVEVRRFAMAASVAVAALCAALAFVRRRRPVDWLPPFRPGRLADDVGLACLSIYVLSFMLGSNFDYRLIFLVGAVPPMLRAYDESGRRSLLILPLMIVAFLWASRVTFRLVAADEILGWVIFCAAVYKLARTLSERLLPDAAR